MQYKEKFDGLWEVLNQIDTIPNYETQSPVIISTEELNKVITQWKINMAEQARLLAKRARQQLELMNALPSYEFSADKQRLRAAACAEIFRHPAISKNASYLDSTSLREQIWQCQQQQGKLVFELGWGQPKKDAGLLKASGPFPDIAEMFALARLGVILQAIQLIYEEVPVECHIITGGTRFFESVFTRSYIDDTYNQQRKLITAALGLEQHICFSDITRYHSREYIREQLQHRMQQHPPAPQDVDAIFRMVLFSIDWHHLLGIQCNAMTTAPHDLPVPEAAKQWLRSLPDESKKQWLRQLLASIANPDIQEPVQTAECPPAVWLETRQWMTAVARISAAKHLLLGLGEVAGRTNTTGYAEACIIPLSVIEKEHKPDIPALLLLGKRYANTMPQHVVGILEEYGMTCENGLDFKPYLTSVTSCRPVFLQPDGNEQQALFQPLVTHNQPLLLIGNSNKEVVSALSGIAFLTNISLLK
ncbi:isocyanide synthase family protein [Chitinophaga pendula]|uniref:L-tyrosine/L-tryptophan isonitrile synthase family protein n=1 Tax=Chitinophaga TaxID=79328 RepID=UPI000BAF969A|nr:MULTISPECIES: L-tyrosine/L-tryptophan isonitrile synthase family protein [Chitinophaga]ASZ11826.1 hypothetical protein CK934_13080 [Chitinophaga sp. MD30]UCJ05153.1 isocyanide synthase family protein [Chitinophaga pendula]